MAHIWYRKEDVGSPSPLSVTNYKYVGEIPHEELEDVFRAMNHVDGSDIERDLNNFGVRSMSVGDIVVNEQGSFLCDRVGWVNLMDDPGRKEFALALAIFGERPNA